MSTPDASAERTRPMLEPAAGPRIGPRSKRGPPGHASAAAPFS
ncbi:hypothetical protein ACFPN7_47295 [Amycolatopsis halotolerans]